MFTIYDEHNGERIFVKTFKDKFDAEVEKDHLMLDFPRFNLIIVEE